MKCPNCNATLIMTERSGVEIDYCPECRGVWLDRGELDKIIERSAGSGSREDTHFKKSDKQQRGYGDDYSYHKKKKKESFLSDLFDF